jgi:hypothetical protein
MEILQAKEKVKMSSKSKYKFKKILKQVRDDKKWKLKKSHFTL